jgi:hypothetical protein
MLVKGWPGRLTFCCDTHRFTLCCGIGSLLHRPTHGEPLQCRRFGLSTGIQCIQVLLNLPRPASSPTPMLPSPFSPSFFSTPPQGGAS